jgi:vitamin B12 transporter
MATEPELSEVVIDVTAGISEAEQMQQSAEAVTVVETQRAQRESADLGDVLRRTQGVGLQRSGGLGSSTRFSLNGSTDDQIRFFLDGVPLEFAGYLGLAVVPVNLIERVELYRGVVPVRFGVDALGGAVNLVTEDAEPRVRAGASYQAGSFGTNRLTAQLRHRFDGTPVVVSANAFYDYADNDYPIDVEVPNDLGQLEQARVYRFHDVYRAFGASLESGVVGVPWAHRLLLRIYATDSVKEQQHNQVMTLPYGEVESSERVQGATLRYESPFDFVPGLSLNLLAAYARRSIGFLDASRWVYDWFGRRISERIEPGEVEAAEDTTSVEHRMLGRVGLNHVPAPEHELRLVSTIQRTSRSGENALYESELFLDPARAEQELLTLVSGLEYELDAWLERIENVAFVKHYYHALSAEQGLDFGRAPIDRGFGLLERDGGLLGAGDALRIRLTPWAQAKASYERAVRLPPAEQVFGDGRLTRANYDLEPEVSHNLNLGVGLTDLWLGEHGLRGELNGFLRDTDNLIQGLPLGTDRLQYHNVWSSRTLGLEASAGWTSPGRFLWLDANVTWVDLRNTSAQGAFADFDGDRVPNRPWLYANASARAQLNGLGATNDELSLTWYTTYVHDFFRSWESAGRSDYKIVIDAQLLHSAALTYLVAGERTFGTTLEMQNLTNERAYDFIGVQKPGRAYYFKATFEL